MKSPKNTLSVWRYFKAGLKPMGRFAFWGPLSVAAVAGILWWQYSQHPEWSGTAFEQPNGVNDVLGENSGDPNNPDIGLEMPLQSIAKDAQTQQQQLPGLQLQTPNSNVAPLTTAKENNKTTSGNDVLSQLSGKKENNESKKDSEESSIFLPLLPTVKDPSALVTTNNKNNNAQNQSDRANSNQREDSALVDGLVKTKPVTVSESPLQQAVQQQVRSVNGTNTNATSTEQTSATEQSATNRTNNNTRQSDATNRDRRNSSAPQQIDEPFRTRGVNTGYANQTATQPNSSYSQNYQSDRPSYNNYPVQINPTQPNSAPAQTTNPYQSPYLNSPVQPNQTQQFPQSSQNPYSSNFLQANPNQSQTQSYQSPYLNTPVQQNQPAQVNQPNYNNSTLNSPQVQRAIDDFGGSP
jgi:hypothetical protein